MMPLTRTPRRTTAIPARYRHARAHVLRILARWEESARRASESKPSEGAVRPARP